jgi:tetratricopeptide (TPR) repeat protein
MASPNLTGSRKNTPKRSLFIAAIWRRIGEVPGAPDVLTGFQRCLRWRIFEIRSFPTALRKFEEALNRAPLAEEVYQGMAGILFKAQLMPEAEAVMARAVALFPASKDVQYYQAQLYRSSLNPRKALELFERLSRMKSAAGLDPELDRLQQSIVYQKIGSIRAELVEFDEAVSAYKKALEILPASPESRLGLGDVYLQQGKPEEALAEYNRVAQTDPKSVPANFRVADTSLRIGRFDAAATAAARVLSLDPTHRRAHYVLATALVRTGEKEKAEKELDLYRKLEADARSEIDRSRDIIVINRGAAARTARRPE